MPAPTLEFGSICLQNAMFLLPSSSSRRLSGEDDWSGEEVKTTPKHVSTLPALPTGGDSLKDLKYSSHGLKLPILSFTPKFTFFVCFFFCRCSILACRAYVALWLGDPAQTLKFAKRLLEVDNLPGGLK